MTAALVISLLLAQNYQGYPVAPRSAGMGGAAVALGSGAGNSFYNPGAIAWSSELTGDVSGNLFAGSLTFASSQFGQPRSTPSYGFQIIPSNMSFEWRGLSLGPLSLSKRWGLGVSVVAPFDVELDAKLDTEDTASLAVLQSTERVYAIYNSIGYRVTDEVGVGLSLVAMYRQARGTMLIDRFDGQEYVSVLLQQSRKSISHGLGVGVQWRPAFGLRAGAAVRLPISAVFGFGEDVGRATLAVQDLSSTMRASLNRQVEARYERPWRFSAGLGYESPGVFALALDAVAFTPMEYVADRDAKTGETLHVTTLAPVLNLAAGGELYVGGTALRVGVFTDHSPYPVGGLHDLDKPRINRYGGTFSVTLDRKFFRTELGLLLSGGQFEATTIDVAQGAFVPQRATGTELRLVVTYSSTFKL